MTHTDQKKKRGPKPLPEGMKKEGAYFKLKPKVLDILRRESKEQSRIRGKKVSQAGIIESLVLDSYGED